MQTNLNAGDIIKFYTDNQELLGIVTGTTQDKNQFKVATLNGQAYRLTPEQIIITMGNYWDSRDFQQTIRRLARIRQ